MIVLGAVGKNGAGKDKLLEYISEKYGIKMFSIGDMCRDIAAKRGVEPIRENLNEISREMLREHGPRYFIDEIARLIKEGGHQGALVPSIRYPSDVKLCKEVFGNNFKLVKVEISDDNVRLERMKKRGSARDPKNMDELRATDAGEEATFQISVTEKMADFTIKNDGTKEDFHTAIDKFVEKNFPNIMQKTSPESPAKVLISFRNGNKTYAEEVLGNTAKKKGTNKKRKGYPAKGGHRKRR